MTDIPENEMVETISVLPDVANMPFDLTKEKLRSAALVLAIRYHDIMSTRATTILNESGDTTIMWTGDRDVEMTAIIQKKMDQGITFFIIEPRFYGLLPSKKTRLKNAVDAIMHRALAISDEDFAKFVSDGYGEAVATPDAPVKEARRSKDAAEIAASESVGVKPLKGG